MPVNFSCEIQFGTSRQDIRNMLAAGLICRNAGQAEAFS